MPCFIIDLGSTSQPLIDEDSTRQLQSWWRELSKLNTETSKLEEDLYLLSKRYLLPSTPVSSQDDETEQTWELTVVNGRLFLETNIRTLAELISYHQASLRYLSPFSGLFEMNPIYFEHIGQSIIPSVFQTVSRSLLQNQESSPTRPVTVPWPLPNVNPHDVVPQLIQKYTTYSAVGGPYIHLPTYLAHYKRLVDPLQDPVTLAICVNMSWSAHRPNIFTASQARDVADYFYSQCLEQLYDIFDDPSRQLEALVTANLLQHYAMLVRLDFSRARRLATICYLICNELADTYADPDIPLIQRVMFQRQHFFAVSMMQALDFSIDGRIKSDLRINLPFLFLDDKLERQREHEVYSHYLRLALSPYIVKFDDQSQRINNGEVGQLNLDAILGYRNFISQWWSTVPKDIQLCSNPFAKNVPELIENATFGYQVLLLAYVHELTMSIHSSLLKPRLPPDTCSSQSELLEMLRKEAVTITVQSTEILIYAVKRVNLAENMGLFCLKFLVKIMTVLCILTELSDMFISIEAQKALKECIYQLKRASPDDHHVPLSSSPLAHMFSLQSSPPPLLGTYKTYPLPGYAFFLDLMQHSMKYLGAHTSFNIE